MSARNIFLLVSIECQCTTIFFHIEQFCKDTDKKEGLAIKGSNVNSSKNTLEN